jgi:hypothetical protein
MLDESLVPMAGSLNEKASKDLSMHISQSMYFSGEYIRNSVGVLQRVKVFSDMILVCKAIEANKNKNFQHLISAFQERIANILDNGSF